MTLCMRFRPGWADITSAGGVSYRLTNTAKLKARRVDTTRRCVSPSGLVSPVFVLQGLTAPAEVVPDFQP